MTVHLCAIPPGNGKMQSLSSWLDLLHAGDVVVCYGHGVQSAEWLRRAAGNHPELRGRVQVFVLNNPQNKVDRMCKADVPGLSHARLLELVCSHGRSCTWK